MFNLENDLSKVTNIPKKYLNKLVTASTYVICDDVKDTMLASDTLTEIDLGFGVISILLDGEVVKYKFVPNKKLDAAINYTIKNNKNIIEYRLEEALKQKVEALYKDLL